MWIVYCDWVSLWYEHKLHSTRSSFQCDQNIPHSTLSYAYTSPPKTKSLKWFHCWIFATSIRITHAVRLTENRILIRTCFNFRDDKWVKLFCCIISRAFARLRSTLLPTVVVLLVAIFFFVCFCYFVRVCALYVSTYLIFTYFLWRQYSRLAWFSRYENSAFLKQTKKCSFCLSSWRVHFQLVDSAFASPRFHFQSGQLLHSSI